MIRFGVLLLAVSACGFTPGRLFDGVIADASGMEEPDALDGSLLDGAQPLAVTHVSAADELTMTGTAAWTVTGVVIDTTNGTATPAFPAGVHVAMIQQDGGGPELLVVQARRIDITSRLRATGSRPLVLVATEEVTVAITGGIDVGANLAEPGAGGASSSGGTGAGGDGSSNGGGQDAGGAGASFGTLGGKGGNGNTSTSAVAVGLNPLPVYGTAALTTLEGGSGGGNPSPMCVNDQRFGGAGGGAVQITAPSIVVDGVIHAGGGGAQETNACAGNGLSGGGGGSGGAIYLQTPSLTGTGFLAANGGGGAGTATGGGAPGGAGQNGMPSSTFAFGGIGQFGSGGDGATVGNAQPGGQGDNGGGGGGGVGRIFLAVPVVADVAVMSSPAAQRSQ